MLGLPLDKIVMLGPILEVLFLSRYVRSISGDFVMLVPFLVLFVTLGLLMEMFVSLERLFNG